MSANHAHTPRLPLPARRPLGEWGSLLELAPSSFALVPPRGVARQGWELLTNAANSRRFVSVLTGMQSHLRAASVPILIQEQTKAPELVPHETLSRAQRRWIGQLALELYFTQLFRSEVAIVDLWSSRLGVNEDGDALWTPRPFYVRWDTRFREGIRDVYSGFFLEDRARFELGVRQLRLGESAHILIEHFGAGNQRSVRFGPEQLRQTVEALVERRAEQKSTLHPNFVAFGLYLIGLHELLGSLDMNFDVRAAFMRTYPGDLFQR